MSTLLSPFWPTSSTSCSPPAPASARSLPSAGRTWTFIAERPTLTICGTIVYVKGQGFFRQEWAKSNAGYRTVTLPRSAVAMLMARTLVAADNPHDAIFTSRRGTWLSTNNVRRQ